MSRIPTTPPNPDYAAVGARIRERRHRLNLTQVDVAERCEVTQSAVSRWESGLKMPGRHSQIQIADVLQVSRRRLFRELLDDARPERAA